jgi:hypothetical protein
MKVNRIYLALFIVINYRLWLENECTKHTKFIPPPIIIDTYKNVNTQFSICITYICVPSNELVDNIRMHLDLRVWVEFKARLTSCASSVYGWNDKYSRFIDFVIWKFNFFYYDLYAAFLVQSNYILVQNKRQRWRISQGLHMYIIEN